MTADYPFIYPIPCWIGNFVGIPFKDGGRGSLRGVDCYGLLRLVWARRFGVDLPEFRFYDDTVRDARAIAQAIGDHAFKLFEPIDPPSCSSRLDPSVGYAVLLRQYRLPLHVAVYAGFEAGRAMVLHTTRDRGHSHLEALDGHELQGSDPLFARLR